MTALSKLAQVALTTRDLPKAIEFYRDALGLKLMFEVSGMAFFDMDGTRLMIGASQSTEPLQNNSYLYFDAGDWY
ncbi:MAG: VOC family protein, partial [Alphaproteobacteria bacterium]|nr:VOC family protein [Alphaproteobacteria bacterium]